MPSSEKTHSQKPAAEKPKESVSKEDKEAMKSASRKHRESKAADGKPANDKPSREPPASGSPEVSLPPSATAPQTNAAPKSAHKERKAERTHAATWATAAADSAAPPKKSTSDETPAPKKPKSKQSGDTPADLRYSASAEPQIQPHTPSEGPNHAPGGPLAAAAAARRRSSTGGTKSDDFIEPEQIQLSQVALLEQQRRQRQISHPTSTGPDAAAAGTWTNVQSLQPDPSTTKPPALKAAGVTTRERVPASSSNGSSSNHTSECVSSAAVAQDELRLSQRAPSNAKVTAPTRDAAPVKPAAAAKHNGAASFTSSTAPAKSPSSQASNSAATPDAQSAGHHHHHHTHNNNNNGSHRNGSSTTVAKMTPMKLSKRSIVNTQKVNEALRRCANPSQDDPPTAEQQELYAMVRVVRMSPIGLLFVAHPEVIISNRAGVIIARNLVVGDEAAAYRVIKVLKPGTLGRSYQAVTLSMMESPTSKSSGLPDTFDERRFTGFGSVKQPTDVVLKVVSCVLRRPSVPKLMSDVRKLINLSSPNVARVADVLRDDHYNVVVCSEYHPYGNACRYAGKFKSLEDTRIMRSIMVDVAIGLHSLHTVKIAHHNVRLENVLQKENRQFCISDAGFSVLFGTESPEALLFNGELAALPPEVFDPDGMYANDDWEGDLFQHLEKVDVWGLGVLMYQLAYGCSPIVISELSSLEAHQKIVTVDPEFPDRPDWPFAATMNDAISRCMAKDPQARPSMFELLSTHDFFSSDFAQRRRASTRQSDANSSAGAAPVVRTPSSFTLNVGANLTARTSSTSSGGSGSPPRIVGYVVDDIISRSSEAETLRVHTRANPSREFAFKVAVHSLQSRFKTSQLPSWAKHQLAFSRKVRHPHIVSNVELIDGEVSGLFIVQEFLSGGPLYELPPVTRPAGEEGPTMQTLIAETLLGLVHLHDNNVPHLSLAPSNIFYTDDQKHFKLIDYGCVCRSVEEMVDRGSNTTSFDLPARIIAESPMSGAKIDVFTMGLLAASALPELFHSVWAQYRRVCSPRDPLSVENIQITLKKNAQTLPADLIDFALVALKQDVTARDLLKHPYVAGVVPAQVPVQLVPLSQVELDEAVKLNYETQVEDRLVSVLGYDPVQENLGASNYSFDAADPGEDVKAVVVVIKGRKIKCTKCGAEMSYALYLCLTCKNYLCCGKCAIDNDHKPGHQLEVYIMYKLEFLTNSTTKVSLIHPSAIKKVHSLEVIEARENLPAGALTGRYAAHRALERSMRSMAAPTAQSAASGGLFQGVTEVQSEIDSDAGSESANILGSTASSVALTSHALAPPTRNSTKFTRLKSLNSISAFGAQLASSADATSPITVGLVPSAPAKNSLLTMMRSASNNTGSAGLSTNNTSNHTSGGGGDNGKKLMLAKEADIDDESPEEELEKCREKRSRELLLFNFSLTEVPRDVYDPPLLHLEVLDLKENVLTSLPDELSFLKNLRKLTVSYNQLTELPAGLGTLTALEEIDASHNLLTTLPDTFVCLSTLKSIALDYNNFTQIPKCLLDIYSNDSPDTSFALAPGERTHSTEVTVAHSTKSLNCLPPGSVAAAQLPGNLSGDRRHASESMYAAPRLDSIYMVANDNLTTFPDPEALRRFARLQLFLDNEPSLSHFYYSHNLEEELPNVTVNWNKNYPDEIIPYLYCGSLRTTQSQMVYKKLDIEYVLTVGRGLTPVKPEEGQQKTVIVDDIPGADIRCSFEESVDFIDESQKRRKGCLVHCFAGLSRSATTVIAYLMMRKGMRLDEAYLVTKKGRPAILPNAGFFAQLVKLDKELFPNATRPLDIESLGRPE